MTSAVSAAPRRVIHASVRGLMHERKGLPNQDSLQCFPVSGRGRTLLVAISDGHGSAKCIRSHRGSALAVKVAVRLGRQFLASTTDDPLDNIEATARRELTQNLAAKWRRAVRDDLTTQPLTEAELTSLALGAGPTARRAVGEDPLLTYLMYGATLMLAIVSEMWILLLQLGDGDVLFVSEAGAVARPLPDDPRLLGNETTSLCMPSASDEFRVKLSPVELGSPALVLLSTDGLSNAYADEEGFFKVGSDILERIRVGGPKLVANELEGWLATASAHSGDDVSAAAIWLSNTVEVPK